MPSAGVIVNQKWIAKNPLILYIEHRGTEARRNKYIEKVKAIEPDFYSVNSVLSKNKALCLCVSVFHSIFFANQFCFTINADSKEALAFNSLPACLMAACSREAAFYSFICARYSDGVRLMTFSNWAMKWVTLLYPDS